MSIGGLETASPPVGAVVARNVATLGAGELVSRVIGFTATIYIARTLGVEAYGIIGFGLAVLLYGSTLVDAGIEHTGPREVAEGRHAQSLLLSSVTLARLLWATVVGAIVVSVALLFFSGAERMVIALYGVALLPVGAHTRWFHLGLQRTAVVSGARVFSDALRVLAILMLVRGPDDLVVVPLAEVGASMVTALVLFAGVRAAGVRMGGPFDPSLAREVFRRAAPMAGSALLAVMIYNADLVFLRIYRSSVEVGLYLAGYTLLNFLGILGHVVAVSLVPALARLRQAPDEMGALFSGAMARAFAAGLPVAVGGAMVAPLLILLVFGDAYAPSARVLSILIWCIPLLLLRSVLQAALIASGRQDLVLRVTMLAAAVNVVLNFVAVPLFGMYGAAATTVIAEAVRMHAAWGHVRRQGYPAVSPLRFIKSTAAGALMAVTLFILQPATVWLAVGTGVLLYGGGLVVSGALRMRGSTLELRI